MTRQLLLVDLGPAAPPAPALEPPPAPARSRAPAPVEVPLFDLAPPTPPEGVPIVECVFARRRSLPIRVRAVSGVDTDGQPVTPGTFCRFPPSRRHAGAKFAVGGLTRIHRKHRFYYATSGPFWLLVPGGSP